ncbi:hypothetical protein IVB12_16150 [Bradyrhizobium sp. 179]|uniref:hypothetical protein n=1 Tax=Bradyrhizobium sp. 179 TaxID=2782648 RepID=UPI001FFA9D9B|nr:hypothetical protein [Bradyrhizobium sp. 179]MCK1543450.1 hypothetical protein [Bradyrhizobium sp. 179]
MPFVDDGISSPPATSVGKTLLGSNRQPKNYSSALSVISTPAASEAHLGEVGGNSAVVAANFARPADTTAYAVGDLVANSVTAGSVAPMVLSVARVADKTGVIRRGRLTKTSTPTANAIFRAHFYKDAPVPANGDNGAFQTAGALTYIGSMDFDMTGANARAFSDGVKCIGVPNVGSEIIFDPHAGSANIYALIEARGAYVPVSGETFTLALEVFRD